MPAGVKYNPQQKDRKAEKKKIADETDADALLYRISANFSWTIFSFETVPDPGTGPRASASDAYETPIK